MLIMILVNVFFKQTKVIIQCSSNFVLFEIRFSCFSELADRINCNYNFCVCKTAHFDLVSYAHSQSSFQQ